MEHFDGTNYGIEQPETFAETAKIIYEIFASEYGHEIKRNLSRPMWARPEWMIFADYAAGLPSILDTCYYYNRSAVDDLGALLEQTETEKAKYTEAQAEEKLSFQIHREIKKAIA